MLRKSEKLSVTVTDVNHLGFGVAKVEGEALFIPGTVTGDLAEIEVIKATKSYAVGRLLALTKASPLREKRCDNAVCRACAYRALAYGEELKIKRESVRQAFRKAGFSDVPVAPVETGELLHYRNKAIYPVAKTKDGYVLGFFAPKSHRVTEAADCPLGKPEFPPILETLRAYFARYDLSVYDETTGRGLLRHVYLRRGEVSGEILLTLVVTEPRLPHADELISLLKEKHKDVVGLLLNVQKEDTNVVLGEEYITLYGRDYIEDTLAGVKLKLSAPAFYQVNHGIAERLYAKVRELAAPMPGETLLDLFCGTGSIGLSMAGTGAAIVGVEIVESAVLCARENAAANGYGDAGFYAGDAAETEKLLERAEGARGGKISPDVVILDPPRGGCDARLIDYVARLSPSRVVYVSCNPETLARDAALFCDRGYRPGEVTPFDMFPMTGHVESVVRFTRE